MKFSGKRWVGVAACHQMVGGASFRSRIGCGFDLNESSTEKISSDVARQHIRRFGDCDGAATFPLRTKVSSVPRVIVAGNFEHVPAALHDIGCIAAGDILAGIIPSGHQRLFDLFSRLDYGPDVRGGWIRLGDARLCSHRPDFTDPEHRHRQLPHSTQSAPPTTPDRHTRTRWWR